MWEPAVLAIKREGYSIKCNGQRGVVLTEKFQKATAVCPYSSVLVFILLNVDLGLELPRDSVGSFGT